MDVQNIMLKGFFFHGKLKCKHISRHTNFSLTSSYVRLYRIIDLFFIVGDWLNLEPSISEKWNTSVI